jgi:catechol 2,3-dioxygenase-like lactoylglutathione lyase family enzyme
MIRGCDHIGIQVGDVERSARFYEENLGFECVERWSLSHPYVQRVVGYYPDVTLEIALLRIPNTNLFLEILEYRGVDRVPIDPATANPGTAHFCLFVDDLDMLYADLVAKGVEFVSEVQTPTWGPNEGGRLVYMKDPDGIRVELVETRKRSDGAVLGAPGGEPSRSQDQ